MTSHLPSLETLVHALENGIVSALDGDMFSHRQLEVYRRRMTRLAGIVKFIQLAQQFIVPTRVVLNRNGYHLSDCVWSLDECKEGPDTCNCLSLFDAPEKYFIVQEVNHVVLRMIESPKTCLEKARSSVRHPNIGKEDETETQCVNPEFEKEE
ncbi:hypothetical protein NPIL_568461 [Nephila pilipes]|uniref:Uncharacterized protein n=1 Tax=Nephila pilipes TaxID=299642 RepID=A0A8X6UH14_NEPPI|nr:hypothetical protein NPIL_568461 [Nephila pilipes]